MPVLADIFSAGNTLKRRMKDFAANPGAFLETEVNYRNQKAGEFNTLQELATQGDINKMRGLPVTPDQQAAELRLRDIVAGAYNPMGITVYHGSRHLFPKFDPKKMGTGEGNQSYGVGAGYTAEAKPVAESYKRMEAEYRKMTGGMEPDVEYAYDLVAKGMSDPQIIDNFAYKYGSQMDFDKAINAIKTAKQYANEGYLYKGDIPDEILPKFLDWDKPLGQQSKEVKQAAKNVWEQVKGNSAFKGKTFDDFLSESGESLYLRLGAGKEGKQADLAATNFLESVGVKGIRYLDQGSRGQGKGTSNFIPFSPDDFKIQEINDEPLEAWLKSGRLQVDESDPLMQFLGQK